MRKNNSSILIITMAGDVHSLAVEFALNLMGQEVFHWVPSEFTNEQLHSFYISNNRLHCDPSLKYFPQYISAVWFRRLVMPKASRLLPKEDRIIAQRETESFIKFLFPFLAKDAFNVNAPDAIWKANNKMLQLELARQAGIRIPETVVSNDINVIKEFLRSSKNVIYKTFFPASWNDAVLYTSKVSEEDLPSAEILKCTPGIFQKYIEKKYELRVTMFGRFPVAVKIHSQNHHEGLLDWRSVSTNELSYEKCTIPQSLIDCLLYIMKNLGIVFGCFDVIVTPDDEYYFLEVNEQGQFLWIEAYNPEIKMLDVFTQFLANGSEDFHYKQTKNSLSLVESVFENSFFKKQNNF
jgi:glutathione synthase/RimK-type ligase-like ATP-grasp enzyme